MWAGPTRRRWNVGLVGPSDVRDLQRKVRPYFDALEQAITKLQPPLPLDQSTFSGQAWVQTSERTAAFLNEEMTSDLNPLAYILAGSAYERGRQVIDNLDGWRDYLSSRKAPNVPDPVPVPHADLGLAGGIGFALAAIVAILVLRDLKH